jgi:hypothetical protein
MQIITHTPYPLLPQLLNDLATSGPNMSNTGTPRTVSPQSLSHKCRRQASVLTITLHSLLCAMQQLVTANVPEGSHEHEVTEFRMESLNSLIHAFSKDETHIQGDMNVFEAFWKEHYVEGFCDVWDSNKGFFAQFPTLEWLKERAEKEGLILLKMANGSSIDSDHAAKIADSVPSLPVLAISFQGGQGEGDRDWMGILSSGRMRMSENMRGSSVSQGSTATIYSPTRSCRPAYPIDPSRFLTSREVNTTFIPQHV